MFVSNVVTLAGINLSTAISNQNARPMVGDYSQVCE